MCDRTPIRSPTGSGTCWVTCHGKLFLTTITMFCDTHASRPIHLLLHIHICSPPFPSFPQTLMFMLTHNSNMNLTFPPTPDIHFWPFLRFFHLSFVNLLFAYIYCIQRLMSICAMNFWKTPNYIPSTFPSTPVLVSSPLHLWHLWHWAPLALHHWLWTELVNPSNSFAIF